MSAVSRTLSAYAIQVFHLACVLALVAVAAGAAPIRNQYFYPAALTKRMSDPVFQYQETISPKGGLR